MSNAHLFGTRPLNHPDWNNTKIKVVGGLHYIKGNTLPHFSLTCTLLEMGRDVGGGAAHEAILSAFPELAPLAAMHLSTIDGVPLFADANGWYWLAGSVDHGFSQQLCTPLEMERDVGGGAAHELIVSAFPELAPLAAMHLATIDGVPLFADANGWYWLAGSVDHGFSQQFHGGNGSPQRSQEECLAIFATTMRMSTAEAGGVLNKAKDLAIDRNVKAAREWFSTWVESQKPRWKAEADKVIADLGLEIFGDPFPGVRS